MSRILVTGASGFVGRRLIPLLMRAGHEVHALRRRQGSSLPKASAWHKVDLLDPRAAAGVVEQIKPEVLVHLAWIAKPRRFWTAPENLDWVASTLALVRAFEHHGGRRFVGAGTCAEYDWAHGVCFADRTPQPALLYGSAKAATYRLVRAFCETRDMSFAWGRIFNLYGPGEHPSTVVAHVVRSLLAGSEVALTEGIQVRDYLHVDDVAAAFALLAQGRFCGGINVGSGEGIAVRDLLGKVGEILGRSELLKFGARTSSTSEPDMLIADAKDLLKLGWTPTYSPLEGLRTAVEYWKQELAHDRD